MRQNDYPWSKGLKIDIKQNRVKNNQTVKDTYSLQTNVYVEHASVALDLLSNNARFFEDPAKQEPFEYIVRKGENAGDQHFLLFS